ncbi:MAG: porin family protein [Lewinellaceae bacterium]|jgi:opacity protein-like surface antigen|nr:porin family protein [Lewinellaceae bacterium]
MKRQILLFSILAASLSAVHAQVAFRPYVGINSHTITKDFQDAEWRSALGYQVGADLQIGSKLYIQPGLQLEYAKNKFEILGTGINIDVKRTSLRIPVMVGYSLGKVDGDFSFRIFTGVNASILLSSSAEDFDLNKDDWKNAVFGWNVGAGLDFSIIFIDLGYQMGLSEVFETIDTGSKDNLFYGNAGLRIRF